MQYLVSTNGQQKWCWPHAALQRHGSQPRRKAVHLPPPWWKDLKLILLYCFVICSYSYLCSIYTFCNDTCFSLFDWAFGLCLPRPCLAGTVPVSGPELVDTTIMLHFLTLITDLVSDAESSESVSLSSTSFSCPSFLAICLFFLPALQTGAPLKWPVSP